MKHLIPILLIVLSTSAYASAKLECYSGTKLVYSGLVDEFTFDTINDIVSAIDKKDHMILTQATCTVNIPPEDL